MSKSEEVPFMIRIVLLVYHEKAVFVNDLFSFLQQCVGDNLVHRRRPEHCESVHNQKAMSHKAAMLNGSGKTASLWR